ncbi:MAG: DNA helicase RecQ [Gammaproteobacteria bacterium]|nr:DNA helicase RecQ [Gammaproteobacteria bacterium]RPG25592.1 MAG: DNA helicase RecQ [Gammaproteobacteria bacterium TMED50]
MQGTSLVTNPAEVLRDTFGYDTFRSPQQEIVETVLGGDDALVIMPTGGGKSLCYQLPSLMLPGVTVVISPLIALMADQVASADQFGIRAAALHSNLATHEQIAIREQLLAGELNLIYLSPERVQQEETQQLLMQIQLSLVAIDEAHCVSQWGHQFRPDYLALDWFRRKRPEIPIIALTATANEQTREEIRSRLGMPEAAVFVAGFDRPNIYYQVQHRGNARDQLLKLLTAHAGDCGIVYCLSRKKVEQTSAWLQTQGYDALPYHAGLSSDTRDNHQTRFLKEDSVIIVATIAFGMGIDKPDVRFVAHLDLPKSIEAYYQETGRAGRDGGPADAWMVYGLQDVMLHRQMLSDQADPQQQRIEQHKLNTMLAFCELTSCRREVLLSYFGDDLGEPCGHCDNCITPPDAWDATLLVQQLLSAIYRTGQRFGAGYVISVVRGGGDPRIERNQHDALQVFGIGKDLSEPEWRSVVRQLLVRGLIEADIEGHGGLRLTQACKPILRGEETISLSRTVAPVKTRRRSATPEDLDYDEHLYEQLRALRTELAEEEGIPPYVIFHDRSLKEMAAMKPDSLSAMLDISGVGQSKLTRYGERFLHVLTVESQTY